MKTGLVVEGGGMRGIYASGVLDAFLKNGIRFDYAVGVSAGGSEYSILSCWTVQKNLSLFS